jgi:hypothetical protein
MPTTSQAQGLPHWLKAILGFSSPLSSSLPKYPADRKRSSAYIEREAMDARQLLGFDPEEPLPSMGLFERLRRLRTGVGRDMAVDYTVTDLRDGVEGESSYVRERREFLVTLSPTTYSGLERDDPRARLTAAHEAGHVSQHWAELIRLSRIPHRTDALQRGSYEDLKPYEDAEWQATEFAGALLVPPGALRMFERLGYPLTSDLVQRNFGVSRACAEKRLRTYGKRKEVWVGK